MLIVHNMKFFFNTPLLHSAAHLDDEVDVDDNRNEKMWQLKNLGRCGCCWRIDDLKDERAMGMTGVKYAGA